MEDVTPAAPAQPETPAPALTAVESAVAKDDFTAYRETRQAERSGTPAPAPAAEQKVEDAALAPSDPKPATAAAPTDRPSKYLKVTQDDLNTRVRTAVDRATADLNAELARLRSTAPPAPSTAPAAGETFPLYAQYLETHPDASLEDYIDARQDFRDSVKAKATHAQRVDADRTRSEREQLEQAHARTLAARQADPAIDAKFKAWETPGAELPEILTIQTRAQAIAARIVPLAINDFASAIASSEFSAQLIAHVADHPEVLERVRALENRTAVNKFVGKLESRFEQDADAAPVAQPPKTISSAPAPGTPIGTRPASAADPIVAAVKGGDFSAFRQAKQAVLAARR